MDRKIRVLDLFAGCGGLTDGFEQAGGYETVACVEWEREPCNTLEQRLRTKWGYKNASEIVLQADIQKVDQLLSGKSQDELLPEREGLDAIVARSGGLDLIVGGPPCQAYSIAGRIRDEHGMHNDYRNFLFESYVQIVDHFRPKGFVFENVPGMLSAAPGGVSIVERIRHDFAKIGYEIVGDLRRFALIDSTDYGVPQARRRVIILGVRKDSLSQPQLALLKFYKHKLPKFCTDRPYTVRDAIADLPKIYPLPTPMTLYGKRYSHFADEAAGKIANHAPRVHNSRDIEIFRDLAADIQSQQCLYTSIEAIKTLYTERTGKESNIHKYYVLRWDQPSNTIPAHLYKDGLRHIHPDPIQARTITVREAARLQTFDDDFEFTGSQTDQYKMVGNAVPPKLALAIAKAVNDFVKEYYE